MNGIIAVHVGAGNHSPIYHKQYNLLSKKACLKGIEVLRQGGSSLEAAKAAVIVLENHPITNAGFGSNLTTQGCVEGDASIMDGRTLNFGACGAIKKVKNPIELAYNLCKHQSEDLPLGLIPPSLLVGTGGLQHAKNIGLKIVSNKSLVSPKARGIYRKYKKLLNYVEGELIDTVGAICVDDSGHVAAASSSGGLILKRPGRVGQAAIYGCGAWADSFSSDEPSLAICTTGCGEHLVQTQLAREIATDLKTYKCLTTGLHKTMTDKFMNSRYLRNVNKKMCGALVMHVDKAGEVTLLWGHSTNSMGVGYMKTTDERPKSMISELPAGSEAGTSVNVGGTFFYMKK